MIFLSVFKEMGRLACGVNSLDLPRPEGGTHCFHSHSPIWDYCRPALARPYGAEEARPEVFRTLPKGTSIAEAMRHTGLFIFFGAQRTKELDAVLAAPNTLCLLFEPNIEQLNAFLEAEKNWCLSKQNVFFLGGDPDEISPPLLSFLPEEMCKLGYPVCFVLKGMEDLAGSYLRRAEELMELFYYRNVIYLLDSQENRRGLPLRPMRKDATYDRHLHFYENFGPCLRSGTLSDLRQVFPGRTAVLVAAGPDLNRKLEFIRNSLKSAVVIAVNNALPVLVAAGIEPHFVVINDTSVESGVGFQGLPPLKRTALVAHCLSASSWGLFPRTFFFGNFPGQPFPKRESLLLHGSVITAAFSLAELLGCSRAILVGAQLASQNPWKLGYSAGTVHSSEAPPEGRDGLIHRWPQLYPVRAANGSAMFTTLNFFDAALWFIDRIKASSMEVVNTCPLSIVAGQPVIFDENPVLPEPFGIEETLAKTSTTSFCKMEPRVLRCIQQALAIWKGKHAAARNAMGSLDTMRAFVALCDADNSSFMLQRYEDFNNMEFHERFFQGGSQEVRLESGRYFCQFMMRMCMTLMLTLMAQHKDIVESGGAGFAGTPGGCEARRGFV